MELTPIDDLIETLTAARRDYYKLYNKNFKVASIRLRQKLEFVIQTSKQMKRDALKYRKKIELEHLDLNDVYPEKPEKDDESDNDNI